MLVMLILSAGGIIYLKLTHDPEESPEEVETGISLTALAEDLNNSLTMDLLNDEEETVTAEATVDEITVTYEGEEIEHTFNITSVNDVLMLETSDLETSKVADKIFTVLIENLCVYQNEGSDEETLCQASALGLGNKINSYDGYTVNEVDEGYFYTLDLNKDVPVVEDYTDVESYETEENNFVLIHDDYIIFNPSLNLNEESNLVTLNYYYVSLGDTNDMALVLSLYDYAEDELISFDFENKDANLNTIEFTLDEELDINDISYYSILPGEGE